MVRTTNLNNQQNLTASNNLLVETVKSLLQKHQKKDNFIHHQREKHTQITFNTNRTIIPFIYHLNNNRPGLIYLHVICDLPPHLNHFSSYVKMKFFVAIMYSAYRVKVYIDTRHFQRLCLCL